jgi:hypothetical protein
MESVRKSPFEKGGFRGIFNQIIEAWWNPFSAPSNICAGVPWIFRPNRHLSVGREKFQI